MKRKQDYLWNSFAGFINALEAVFMSIVVTRVTGLNDAGILAIAFAIGNLFMTIGKYGIRNYQVTDVDRKYTFRSYFVLRVVTVTMMAVVSFGYSFYSLLCKGYDFYKASCILAICVIYCVEAVEDVLWGELQRNGRLDIGAKLFCTRWISIFAVFCLLIILSGKLNVALWGSVGISVIVFVFLSLIISKDGLFTFNDKSLDGRLEMKDIKIWGMSACKELLFVSFPLFVMSFLTFFVNNSPKYAIDGLLNEEAQACYGFVAMPVFVIGLLNGFIYQPSLVNLSVEWSRRSDIFIKKVIRQAILLGAISVACIIGAALIGIPVLSVIYKTDLTGYWFELVVLQGAGFFLALSGYLSVVLTIMRHNKSLMWGYLIVGVLAFLIMDRSVTSHGTKGAALTYLGCMAVLCIIYLVMFTVYYKRERNG